MAEGYARSFGDEWLEVQSAGVAPAGIHPMTMQVMREDGIDIGGQWSKSIYEIDAVGLDYLVTVCGNAQDRCPTLPVRVRREHWPIADPIAVIGDEQERKAKFKEIRDEIRGRVKDLVSRLSAEQKA
jgi:arsenate reductase